MNMTILIGNLGEAPIVRATTAGTSVTTFSLATTEKWKDAQGAKHEKTTWHKVQAWGAQATTCATYLKKGSKLQVTGRLENQPWTDKDGVKRNPMILVMTSMEMLGDPGHVGNAPAQPASPVAIPAPPAAIPAPPAPTGITHAALIGNGWSPEQIASSPEYGHLKPVVAAPPAPPQQQGFYVAEGDIPM